MFGSQKSTDYGAHGFEFSEESVRHRGRTKAGSATRSRSKKHSTRKRNSSTPITGMSHRRRRRWSW